MRKLQVLLCAFQLVNNSHLLREIEGAMEQRHAAWSLIPYRKLVQSLDWERNQTAVRARPGFMYIRSCHHLPVLIVSDVVIILSWRVVVQRKLECSRRIDWGRCNCLAVISKRQRIIDPWPYTVSGKVSPIANRALVEIVNETADGVPSASVRRRSWKAETGLQ